MTDNKIWEMRFYLFDRYAQSHWSEEAKRNRRRCPQCGGGLFTPEALLLLWDDYRREIPPIFNEGVFGGLALHKRLGEAIVERFAGLELYPLNFEYSDWLRNQKKYRGRELVYKGPEVAFLYPKNRVWCDLSGAEWAYACQCSRCGRVDFSRPETERRLYPPNLKIPASQIRDKDFFWLHGGGSFCTTAFKTFLEENDDGAGFVFLDGGEIYDDGDTFVPPVLPEWPPQTDDVKKEAPKAAAAPVAAVVEPPKRKPRRKSVLCEDLDPATIQKIEDVEKYLIKLQTPENESEATCPESLDALKEYIALEISDEIRRMRFLRVAKIQETVYWLWKLYDEGGSPCYAYVARTPQAVEMGVADAFEATPEQFLYLTHFDLYNLYFE